MTPRSPSAPRNRWIPRSALALALLAGAGCAKPLFPTDQDRTPFDRYDGIRNREEPAQTLDEYGRRRPNLRGRLSRR